MTTLEKEIKELNEEILAVTLEIREKHPELYELLDETPLFTSIDNNGIDPNSLVEYLNTIRSLSSKHNETTESK